MPLTKYLTIVTSSDLAVVKRLKKELETAVREEKYSGGISAATCYGMLYWHSKEYWGFPFNDTTTIHEDLDIADEYIEKGANLGCPLGQLLRGIKKAEAKVDETLTSLGFPLMQILELKFPPDQLQEIQHHINKAIVLVKNLTRSTTTSLHEEASILLWDINRPKNIANESLHFPSKKFAVLRSLEDCKMADDPATTAECIDRALEEKQNFHIAYMIYNITLMRLRYLPISDANFYKTLSKYLGALEYLACRGEPKAFFVLAEFYLSGWGIPKDRAAAAYWHSEFYWEEKGQDSTRSLDTLRDTIQHGDVRERTHARICLMKIHYRGFGKDRNPHEATKIQEAIEREQKTIPEHLYQYFLAEKAVLEDRWLDALHHYKKASTHLPIAGLKYAEFASKFNLQQSLPLVKSVHDSAQSTDTYLRFKSRILLETWVKQNPSSRPAREQLVHVYKTEQTSRSKGTLLIGEHHFTQRLIDESKLLIESIAVGKELNEPATESKELKRTVQPPVRTFKVATTHEHKVVESKTPYFDSLLTQARQLRSSDPKTSFLQLKEGVQQKHVPSLLFLLDLYLTGSNYDQTYDPKPDLEQAFDTAVLAFQMAFAQHQYPAAIQVLVKLVKMAVVDSECSEVIRLLCEGLELLKEKIQDKKLLLNLMQDVTDKVADQKSISQVFETIKNNFAHMPKEFYLLGVQLFSSSPILTFEYCIRAVNADVDAKRTISPTCAELQKLENITKNPTNERPSQELINLLFKFYQPSSNTPELQDKLGKILINLIAVWKIEAAQEFLRQESNSGSLHASCLLASSVVAAHDLGTVTQHYQLILKNWNITAKTKNNVDIFINCYKTLKEMADRDFNYWKLLIEFQIVYMKTIPCLNLGVNYQGLNFYDVAKYTETKDETTAKLAEEFLKQMALGKKDFFGEQAYLNVCLKKANDPKFQIEYEQKILAIPSLLESNLFLDPVSNYLKTRKKINNDPHDELFFTTVEDIRLKSYIANRNEQKESKVKNPGDKVELDKWNIKDKTAFTQIRNMVDDITCPGPVRKKAACYVFTAYRDKSVASEAKRFEFDERPTKALEYAQLGLGLLEPECIAFVGKENRRFRANRRAYLCAFLSVLTNASDAREARNLLTTNHPHAIYYTNLLPSACEFKRDDATTPQQVFQLIINGPLTIEGSTTTSTITGFDEEAVREEIRNVVMPELKLDPHQFLAKPASQNPEAKEIHFFSHAPGDAKEFKQNRPSSENPELVQVRSLAENPDRVAKVKDAKESKQDPRPLAENPDLAAENARLRAQLEELQNRMGGTSLVSSASPSFVPVKQSLTTSSMPSSSSEGLPPLAINSSPEGLPALAALSRPEDSSSSLVPAVPSAGEHKHHSSPTGISASASSASVEGEDLSEIEPGAYQTEAAAVASNLGTVAPSPIPGIQQLQPAIPYPSASVASQSHVTVEPGSEPRKPSKVLALA